MTPKSSISKIIAKATGNDTLNFWFTNRIPRATLTRFVGWFSKVEQPWVRDASIGLWKLFSDLDLSEARHTRFRSMHECFIRELKEGARPIDRREDILTSPCDAIIGECGRLDGDTLLQAKSSTYTLEELVVDPALAARFRDGTYVTLRLTSSMYHRFHAPHDCTIEKITYIAGDAYNVNPPTLRRIPKLFCKNERATIRVRLPAGDRIALVPVAAVLVASIRFRFLDVRLHLRYAGPNVIPCDHTASKGDELGWFEHGSTIIVLAPPGFELEPSVCTGRSIRMGEALLSIESRDRAAGAAQRLSEPSAGTVEADLP